MSDTAHNRVMRALSDAISRQDWDRLGDVFHDDAALEFPQSGELFVGIDNIRGQFANYPALDPDSSQLAEVIGDTVYALSPSYTVIRVDGSGERGTAIVRIRYPDGTWWWAINLFEMRGERIGRARTFFAPDFPAPASRAPYRAPSP